MDMTTTEKMLSDEATPDVQELLELLAFSLTHNLNWDETDDELWWYEDAIGTMSDGTQVDGYVECAMKVGDMKLLDAVRKVRGISDQQELEPYITYASDKDSRGFFEQATSPRIDVN